ncbi:MAG: hypothetical protein DLM50_00900 [Candidatus Meridianibacter frigidus]|nr:MAG: hypothetical protein DLM50_00900 [Candidatus Eremiobacteraeota bacterium]
MGGSQGARSINEAVAALVTRRALPANWQVLHISGRRDYDYMKAEQSQLHPGNTVVLLPYLDDLSEAYAASDLIVARSGASTLGELATLALPSILIPYPHAAQDHQRVNAQVFADAGAAMILEDKNLNGDALWWTLRSALEPQNYDRMQSAARSLARADATGAILQRTASLLKRKTAA